MRHQWGKLINGWHDEGVTFHLLRDDGSPTCGTQYHATTGPYPYPETACYPRCQRCQARANKTSSPKVQP